MVTAPVKVVEPTSAETHAVLSKASRRSWALRPDGAPRLDELCPPGSTWACGLFDPDSSAHSAERRLTFAIYPSLAGRKCSQWRRGRHQRRPVRAFARIARIAFVDVQRAKGKLMAAVKGEGRTALFLDCDVTDVVALQASIAEARAKLARSRFWSTTPPATSAMLSPTSPPLLDHAQNEFAASFFAAQAVHPQMRELGTLDHESFVDRLAARQMPAYRG